MAVGPDADGPLLARFLDRAGDRLDAAVYEVGPSFAWRFAAAARRGAGVRLLLDAHGGANTTTARVLHGERVAVRLLGGRPGREVHLKVLVAGKDAVAVGTGNLIGRDAPMTAGASPPAGTREWWAVVEGAPALAARARSLVVTAWRQGVRPPLRRAAVPEVAPPVGAPTRFTPVTAEVGARRLRLVGGGVAVASLLGGLASHATERMHCTVPYVHAAAPAPRRLLTALAAAAARGVDVRLLLGLEPTPEDVARLAATGICVRVMQAASWTAGHAKGMVADATAVVASANWSAAGLGGNLEAALAVGDATVADALAAVFAADWEAAEPLRPGVPPGGGLPLRSVGILPQNPSRHRPGGSPWSG